jgi:uncharacterized protein (TIGR00266 family)
MESGTTVDGVAWQKTGSSGNANVDIFLKSGQSIVADKHAMVYMDGDMQLKTEMGALKKALGRMFSGETAFLSYYSGTNPNKAQCITLGVPVPGDVMYIPLAAGEKWKLSRGSFLAGTNTVTVSGKLNLKGAVGVGQQEGMVLSLVTAEKGAGGVWVAAYGHIERHDLKEGESLLVDNENFLACPSNVDYNIAGVGGVKSMVFGGEGLAMKFQGPCTLYTQSKGIIALASFLRPYIDPGRNRNGSRGVGNAVSNAFNNQ